jgi:hypothetical protein
MKNNLIYVEMVKIIIPYTTQKKPHPHKHGLCNNHGICINDMQTQQNGVHTVGG